jgi:hypothetical protein
MMFYEFSALTRKLARPERIPYITKVDRVRQPRIRDVRHLPRRPSGLLRDVALTDLTHGSIFGSHAARHARNPENHSSVITGKALLVAAPFGIHACAS